eukprot:5212275-Lingulodinium_polyedra.AAC.1
MACYFVEAELRGHLLAVIRGRAQCVENLAEPGSAVARSLVAAEFPDRLQLAVRFTDCYPD